MNNNYKPKKIDLLGFLIFPLLGFVYSWLNSNHQEAIYLSSPFDDIIPFFPIFIIPYIIWYPYVFLSIFHFWRKERSLYWKALLLITAGEVICFIIYYFFQTTVPRPIVKEEGLFNTLVHLIYERDEPYNCFPSIHVLTTSIIMLVHTQLKSTSNTGKSAIHILGTLIITSTLFVKQHVIYDMLASIIISLGFFSLVFNGKWAALNMDKKKNQEEEYQSARAQ